MEWIIKGDVVLVPKGKYEGQEAVVTKVSKNTVTLKPVGSYKRIEFDKEEL